MCEKITSQFVTHYAIRVFVRLPLDFPEPLH